MSGSLHRKRERAEARLLLRSPLMSKRAIVAIALAAMAAFAFAVWNISIQMTPPPSTAGSGPAPGGAGTEPAQPEGPAPGEAEAPDPGLVWSVPGRWTIDLAQGMRIATYLVPGAPDQGAECAVYYFGPGMGGGVEANLERWKGEFRTLDKHDVRKMKPGGIDVTRIRASGTYVAHSMRGGGPDENPDWELLGGIVSGPKGDIFFKLTGPATTVEKAALEFDGMLGSMRAK